MNIEKMSDEKCLEKFIALLENRVSITTGFAQQNEDGTLTHQYLVVKCGPLEVISQPEPLEVPLRLANAQELNQPVN